MDPPRRRRATSATGTGCARSPRRLRPAAQGGATWPFFLEWERRAVRPSTMSARLAPYLRYYSSHRPTDDPRRAARSPHRLRRRHRPDPLPAPGPGGDAGQWRGGPPVGLPPGGRSGNGAAGPRLAHPPRMGVAPGPAAPIERGVRKNHAFTERQQEKGPRRSVGRTVVRLDAAALWRRLDLLNRSRTGSPGRSGSAPATCRCWSTGGARPPAASRRRMRKALGVTNTKELFKLEDCDEQP